MDWIQSWDLSTSTMFAEIAAGFCLFTVFSVPSILLALVLTILLRRLERRFWGRPETIQVAREPDAT